MEQISAKNSFMPEKSTRPHLVYHLNMCCKTDNDTGSWACSIHESNRSPPITLSGSDTGNYQRIRIIGLRESFSYIFDSLKKEGINISNIDLEFLITSSDVFLVNLLREWIPLWYKETEVKKDRLNGDLLDEIYNYTKGCKLSVKWRPDENVQIKPLFKKVEKMLKTTL